MSRAERRVACWLDRTAVSRSSAGAGACMTTWRTGAAECETSLLERHKSRAADQQSQSCSAAESSKQRSQGFSRGEKRRRAHLPRSRSDPAPGPCPGCPESQGYDPEMRLYGGEEMEIGLETREVFTASAQSKTGELEIR